MSHTPEVELAWAAGFFDGEGCTSLHRGQRVVITVTQTNKEPLERFKAAVGCGNINGPYPASHSDKLVWRWTAGGEAAIDAAAKLFDFLCQPKQDQMITVIAARMNLLEQRAEARKTCRNGHDTTTAGRTSRGYCLICKRERDSRASKRYRKRQSEGMMALMAEHIDTADVTHAA